MTDKSKLGFYLLLMPLVLWLLMLIVLLHVGLFMVSISEKIGVREYETGITGLGIAESISKSLAKAVIAIEINGELSDLSLAIHDNASIALIKRADDQALEMIRHDAAHVMAEAVQNLFPGTQVTIGPSIENGF